MADAPTVRYVKKITFLCEAAKSGFKKKCSNTSGLLINENVVPELQL